MSLVREQANWNRLAEMIGAENISSGSEWLAERGWDGPLPAAVVYPGTAAQVCEILRLAHAERLVITPAGHGTKQRMGGVPQRVDLLLSLSKMNRITDYPAADLTISVEAGLGVADLAAALRAKRQMLPLDVPFAAEATVGGAVAANSSGPRRLAYGTFRDVVIGMRFVTAEGKLAKSGGKVVKNVAGYDMAKLLIGSFGSLGVITDVNFKVFPLPLCSRTFVLGFSDATKALQARHRILNSPLLPQALDLVDSAVGTLTQQAALAAAPYSLVMAAAGPEAVIQRFERDLADLVRPDRPESIVAVSEEAEAALWHAVQELTPTAVRQNPEAAVVKVSVVLSGMEHFLDTARRAALDNGLEHAMLARAGTGIVYCYLWEKTEGASGPPAAVERACRALLQEADWVGGRAIIEWCCKKLKDKVAWWGSLQDDFPLMQRLKKQWDPEGILNPGRFYGGL